MDILIFFRRAVMVLACLVVALGPAQTLQLAAWSSMMVRGLPGSSLAKVVTTTFSGRAPCGMCRVAESLAAEERAQPSSPGDEAKKPDYGVLMDRWRWQPPGPGNITAGYVIPRGGCPLGTHPLLDEPVPRV